MSESQPVLECAAGRPQGHPGSAYADASDDRPESASEARSPERQHPSPWRRRTTHRSGGSAAVHTVDRQVMTTRSSGRLPMKLRPRTPRLIVIRSTTATSTRCLSRTLSSPRRHAACRSLTSGTSAGRSVDVGLGGGDPLEQHGAGGVPLDLQQLAGTEPASPARPGRLRPTRRHGASAEHGLSGACATTAGSPWRARLLRPTPRAVRQSSTSRNRSTRCRVGGSDSGAAASRGHPSPSPDDAHRRASTVHTAHRPRTPTATIAHPPVVHGHAPGR